MSFQFWWTLTVIANFSNTLRYTPEWLKPLVIIAWVGHVVFFVSLIWQMVLPLLGN